MAPGSWFGKIMGINISWRPVECGPNKFLNIFSLLILLFWPFNTIPFFLLKMSTWLKMLVAWTECIKCVECTKCTAWCHDCPLQSPLYNPFPTPHPAAWPQPFCENMRVGEKWPQRSWASMDQGWKYLSLNVQSMQLKGQEFQRNIKSVSLHLDHAAEDRGHLKSKVVENCDQKKAPEEFSSSGIWHLTPCPALAWYLCKHWISWALRHIIRI